MPVPLRGGRSGSRAGPPAPTTRRTSISCAARSVATITTRISPRRASRSTPASIRAPRTRPSTRSSPSWRASLAESLNLATVGVGLDVGLPKVADTLQRFGLPQPPLQVPAMLLGAVEVTPLEAAQLFNGLASGGFHNPLRAVRAVISADGKPLKAFPLEVSQVASPEAVYQLDRMLVEVMERGTGRGARAVLPAGLTVAGKSGTSSDFRDSWFAGFSGSHLAVVWVGYDSDEPTGFTGSAGALPVWAHIMAGLNTSSGEEQPPPSERPPAQGPRQFRLGPAATALVTQAHAQAGSGEFGQAAATLERALRIEPDNPLLWIELGRVRLGEGNAAQADAMGRKAVALATGDPSAQAAGWRLIADSLRARGRDPEAADAEQRAGTLSPH